MRPIERAEQRRPGAMAVALIGVVLVASSCRVTSSASSTPTPVNVTTAPGESTPPGVAPAPSIQITEPPPEIPVFDDAAFLAASTAACNATKPAKVYAIDTPTSPPGKVSDYRWLHILVLEMRREDGTGGPPPPLPPDSAYYADASSLVTIPGGTGALAIEAPIGAWVEVLACVALRLGASKTYSGDRDLRVTGLDAIVWIVDRATGALVGEPWIVEAGLPTFLNADLLVRFERMNLFPANVREDVNYFLGQAVPSGGAYQGGEDTSVVAEYDKRIDLPEGTRLLPGHTFVLRLVVLPGSEGRIDFVDVLCAPVGRIAGPPLRIGSAVPHDLGSFSVSSADVAVEGEFETEFLAGGAIRGLSARARDCGVPRSASWFVSLASMVQAAGDGYQVVVP